MLRSNWLLSVHGLFRGSKTFRRRTQSRLARQQGHRPADVSVLESRKLLSASAPENAPETTLWQEVESFSGNARGVSYLQLSDYTPLVLNEPAMRQTLDQAPDQAATGATYNTSTVTLADPNGHLQRFTIYESAIMAPELAAQFPNIKTYAGQGIDDPTATVQLDMTPEGFHAQVLSANGRWYVDPYFHLNDDFYASYFAAASSPSAENRQMLADLEPIRTSDIVETHGEPAAVHRPEESAPVAARSGTQLRTYRTAVAATGEYTAFHGGTVAAGQAAIVTAINRVSGIYENELSIRLQLIANNSSLVYTNAATDPYSNSNPGALLDENQDNIDTLIGNANYDIGHVFTTGGGGLAGLGVVGITGSKAEGETGLSNPIGDPFYVDYVAHEMGHQFGGNHTFNTAADPNRNASTAYEPGSGSTIQAYAGIIFPTSENLQNNSDAYFHSVSFDEIIRHVDQVVPNAGTRTATGNSVPTVDAGLDYTIPASTPFVLTAAGDDADGTDSLTYNWEERDLGPATLLSAADNGLSPLFRSFSPTTDPSRTFLRLTDLVNNTTTPGEKLPTTTRTMNFRATVRDNNVGGGGVNTDDMRVNVVNTGAPFRVTAPATPVTWDAGSVQTVTWDVAGTTGNGINTANVRILLSTDGGLTSSVVLAASVPNNGSAQIVVPAITTSQARIRVEAIGNIFFDISDINFSIDGNANQTPVLNDQSFNVSESASVGATVGTIVATDPNPGDVLTYAITGGNPGNLFAINPTTGVITVNGALNSQITPSVALTVQVTDLGGLSDTGVVTVNVLETNIAPVVPPQSFSLVENRPAGFLLGNVTSTDSNSNQTYSYAITSGNTGGAFQIDAATGALTVLNSAAINFEVTPTFQLAVEVTDNGLPPLSGSGVVTINLTNANDPPKVGPKTFSVIEDAAVNTVVGTVTATDEDSGQTRTFAITSGNVGNAFQIDANTGVITVKTKAAIDWEVTPVFSLQVTATDNGVPSAAGSGIIKVNVTNINDAPTGISFANATTNLAENVAKTSRVKVADIVIKDDGLGVNQLSLTGIDAAVFEIFNGALFVRAGTDLNFEAKPTYAVTVNVDDVSLGNTPDASANFLLKLIDVNEAPVFAGKTVTLPENSPIGTVVATGIATDPDAGQSLTYSITAGNRNNAFAINPNTGVVTVNNPAALDWENEPPYELKIAATDNGTPTLSTAAVLKVLLTNVNDAPSVYRAFKTIPENLAKGTVVLDYKVVAKDQDAGQTLTYAITAGNEGNAFAIDAATGIITVNNPQELDYENQPPFELTISVKDNGVPALTSLGSLRISLSDVNDAPRVYNGAVSIPENAPNGTTVLDYKIVGRDQDLGQTLTFAILSGNRDNAFAINPDTGIITVKNSTALDFEKGGPFDLEIAVTDTGTPAITSKANLRVNLTNVNDHPQFTNASVVILENLPTGTTVFDLKTVAKDVDAGQTLKYAITAGNRNNAFKVDANTGIVTVDNTAALDWENAPPFNLTISVTDSGNPTLTTSGSLKAYLKDANDAPRIYNAAKTIPENLPAGSLVLDYTIVARDQDIGQTLSYAITAGNTANAFVIDPITGLITVNNAAAIDFETNSTFVLTIKVTDDGTPLLSSSATLTISLKDIKEPATVVPATFTLPENTVIGTSVGTVTATTPPESGKTRTFAITGGNPNNAFSINATTGQIEVNNSAALNFEGTPTFSLIVTITDSGAPTTTGSGVIKVNLTNVNEAPVLPAQSLAVKTFSPVGTVVGTVVSSDPDPGQTHTYAIVSGNGILNNVFAIDAATGKITVSNALGLISAREFNLVVRVTDSGSPALSSTGNVRIVVNATGALRIEAEPVKSSSSKLLKKAK